MGRISCKRKECKCVDRGIKKLYIGLSLILNQNKYESFAPRKYTEVDKSKSSILL